MTRPLLALVVLTGCGASSGPVDTGSSWQHAALVDATVLRSLSVEDGELSDGQRAEARAAAIESVAESVDALSAGAVEDLRLDVQIAEIDEREAAVRARCLVTVSTVGPPERTRSILQGAATAPRRSGDDTARAVVGAVRAALRRLPDALAAIR